MIYELVKQLKDEEFPLRYINDPRQIANVEFEDGSFALFPTLSELIEACGNKFAMLMRNPGGDMSFPFWSAYEQYSNLSCNGSTPEEAVANLWLSLNKK